MQSNRFGSNWQKGKFCLKGGTALHLFILDMLRLSEDIDLNYIGSVALTDMQAERPQLEAVLQKLFREEGLILVRSPQGQHTGGKWSLQDPHLPIGDRHLSVDILFGYRVPLWAPAPASCKLPGHTHVADIPILDIHDLVGGKLAALLSRRKARDVFDACALFALPPGNLDLVRLRTAFVVYGAMHRQDWRTCISSHVDCDPQELVHNLWPMLPLDTRPHRIERLCAPIDGRRPRQPIRRAAVHARGTRVPGLPAGSRRNCPRAADGRSRSASPDCGAAHAGLESPARAAVQARTPA